MAAAVVVVEQEEEITVWLLFGKLADTEQDSRPGSNIGNPGKVGRAYSDYSHIHDMLQPSPPRNYAPETNHYKKISIKNKIIKKKNFGRP